MDMTKKEMAMKVLEEMGYKPQEDSDGDIMVRYQMKSIFIMPREEEESYMMVFMPQFYDVKEGEEHVDLAVCNKLTRELKLTKVFADSTFKNINATCEFYYTDEDSLRMNFEKSLRSLGTVRTLFYKTREDFMED